MAHPSCIKIPSTKESHLQKMNGTENTEGRDQLTTNNELISIANEVFGHRKWSHSVTNQTLDFVEYVMGKYHVGCAAFVRVQLNDGTFHEDMGYSSTEKSNKTVAVYSARTASITNALKKVLLCFGGDVEKRIKHLIAERSNDVVPNFSTIGEPQQFPKPKVALPCAHSTPMRPVSPKLLEVNDHLASNTGLKRTPSPKMITVDKEDVIVLNHELQDPTAMTEEEIRLERKRKQKLKQEEYKKKMKEKELQTVTSVHDLHNNSTISTVQFYTSNNLCFKCSKTDAFPVDNKHVSFIHNAAIQSRMT